MHQEQTCLSEHGEHPSKGFHGPKCWVLSAVCGLVVGFLLSFVLPKPQAYSLEELKAMGKGPSEKVEKGAGPEDHAHENSEAAHKDADPAHAVMAPKIPLFYASPFAMLLLAIALMPFISLHFWEHHFPDFAFFLGGIVVAYYLGALNGFTDFKGHANYGSHKMMHVGLEYFQFIALVGSLYVVTGGIHLDIKGKGAPLFNTLILAFGAVIANIIGTTGAAALLIRSYIRINKHRIRPFHVVLFIFIVANCGGCLTPIGDPPLFLGYLQGIPFTWTLYHLITAWTFCVGMLLFIFFLMDTLALKKYLAKENENGEAVDAVPEKNTIRVDGYLNFVFLGIILFGVFFDTLLADYAHIHVHGVGAVLQVLAAAAAYKLSKPENLKANDFNFAPIEEVGFLFIGLFATMVPALDYLGNNASSLGINTPSKFYWATGALSSFLDNAPTYLNFLSAGHGLEGMEMGKTADTLKWLAVQNVGQTGFSAEQILLAISLSAVCFGANTYIGNAPNFMVKAIAESSGVPMPTFFGYIIKYSLPILVLLILPLMALIFLA